MTILDALQNAKRLQSERSVDGGVKDRTSTPQVRRGKLEVSPIAVAQLDYPRLSVDQVTLERNRVLMTAPPGSPHARALDCYRILRTRLRSRLGTEPFASLGIVSGGPDEGKSLTAVNLALSFANEKRRNVFLLDLDLRNPSLCRYLCVTPKVELGTCLAHASNPEDVFFTIGVENLSLAGGLTSHDNSSELLGGTGLADVLDYIKRTDPNALTIVDLPPLLQSADSMVVAPRLTTLLLVVGEGVARRDQLGRAAELLHGMPVAGVVLNRSQEAIEDYYG